MLKIYLKQAWTLMRQNKLFTSIYVVGTGLSIALIMILFIIFYVKFAPIYPEYNRNRTLVIKPMERHPKGKPENYNRNSGVSYRFMQELLTGLPHVEAVGGGVPGFWNESKVLLPNGESLPASHRSVDGGFWKVFNFRFLNGQPFTQEEVDAGVQVAVISKSLAISVFATEDVTGEHLLFGGDDYLVCGVVDDVSNATPDTSGDLWIPLTESDKNGRGLLGNIWAYLLVDEAANKEAVKEEVRESVRKFTLQDAEYDYDLMGQPDDYWMSTFRTGQAPDFVEIAKAFLYMLLALLFIPALNLSGMISSRMDKRLCELGIRKAYGATNRRLLHQVLCENLLLTVIGGLAGLLFSYLIVLTASDWILTLFDKGINIPGQHITLTFEMLFNPTVFGCAFGLCIVLNTVSALLPAVLALRHPIIRSLHTNR